MRDSNGELSLVVRRGDAAPGTDAGVYFFDTLPYLNNAGQIAIHASLTGEGVDSSNDYGLWVRDTDGQFQLIVREGDLFDVNDDPLISDWRTIESMGGDLNDAGQIAFKLGFTDGSWGVFVATIPEPGSVVLVVCGAVGMWRRNRMADV